MDHITLSPTDDYRHSLEPGQHEAFYFLFTAQDGAVYGFLRTLFDQKTVLEMAVLHSGERTWAYQRRIPLSDTPPSPGDASGDALTLTCLEPWQSWRCRFQGTVRDVAGEGTMPVTVDLTFAAINDPALYSFGPYHQVQQDGHVRGQLQIGSQMWTGEMVCCRDRSWGVRPMGVALRWTLASVPDRLYAVVVETRQGPAGFGRFRTPDGPFRPVHLLRVAATDGGWRLEDPTAGLAAWHVQRIVPPLVGYLGPAGQEEMRTEPRPGDLLRDELGPALFTSPEGKRLIGFLEQAEGLT